MLLIINLRTAIRHFEEPYKKVCKRQRKAAKVIKVLDKLASKGVIHKNHAARKKSRLTRKLNKTAS